MSADPSLDVDTLIIASAATLFSVGAWISATRARREQAKASHEQITLNREQVEDQAFTRIQGMYTTALETQAELLKVANARIAEQNQKIGNQESRIIQLESVIADLQRKAGPHGII